MARINLTIPDDLYERLEQVRDRVNVSKICAVALAKELDMVEGIIAPVAANPKAQRLIERLQRRKAQKDRWMEQGYADGENWAADIAEPKEIRFVIDEWDMDEDEKYNFHDVEFPESFNLRAALRQSVETLGQGSDTPEESEQDAYLRGWSRAVRDLWKAAKPSLHWLENDED